MARRRRIFSRSAVGFGISTTQTDLLAPVPVRDLFTGQLTGADGPVYVLLYRWLDGESVPVADTTVQQVQRIGTYLAQLHAMHPPEPLGQLAERPTLDYEGLFGARSPYASQHETEFITPAQQETLSAVAERVREVMQNQADDQFGFIHGDFIYKNTLITPAGDVAAIDYENSGFGYYLYDLACPLLFFYKPLPNYTALKNALWTGYTDRRPLADAARDNLEGFVAGRYVASCRWVAAHANHPTIDGRAPEIIAERVDELRNFLQTGAL